MLRSMREGNEVNNYPDCVVIIGASKGYEKTLELVGVPKQIGFVPNKLFIAP